MSIIPVFIKCEDQRWYKNPVWYGKQRTMNGGNVTPWFVCVDDEEPPELVVRVESERPILTWFNAEHPGMGCMRVFDGKFRDAQAHFGKLLTFPPIPDKYDSSHDDRPSVEGVFHDFKEDYVSFEQFMEYVRRVIGPYCGRPYWLSNYYGLRHRNWITINQATSQMAINAIGTDAVYKNG